MRDKFGSFRRGEGDVADRIRREVERVFDDLGIANPMNKDRPGGGHGGRSGWGGGGFGAGRADASGFSVSVDVAETDTGVEVHADLPGVAPEAVEVSVEGRTLVIRGERTGAAEAGGRDWRVRERAGGAFLRRVPLPFEPAPDTVEADYDHGVLTVTVPRPAGAPARAVKVNVRSGGAATAASGMTAAGAASSAAAGPPADAEAHPVSPVSPGTEPTEPTPPPPPSSFTAAEPAIPGAETTPPGGMISNGGATGGGQAGDAPRESGMGEQV